MKFLQPLLLASALAAASLIAGGCSYRTQTTYRQDIRSVSVPIFKSADPRRGAEFQLTEAIVKQIEATTPYKVQSRDDAQTIIEGQILSISSRTISSDPVRVTPQEQLLTIRVQFIWKDIRTGKILVERKNFEHSTPYYATLGESRFIATQQAIEKLAAAIVQELAADW